MVIETISEINCKGCKYFESKHLLSKDNMLKYNVCAKKSAGSCEKE